MVLQTLDLSYTGKPANWMLQHDRHDFAGRTSDQCSALIWGMNITLLNTAESYRGLKPWGNCTLSGNSICIDSVHIAKCDRDSVPKVCTSTSVTHWLLDAHCLACMTLENISESETAPLWECSRAYNIVRTNVLQNQIEVKGLGLPDCGESCARIVSHHKV